MKVIYEYIDPSGGVQTLVRYSDVPRTGDVVRMTNFPETEENYSVTSVLWSINKDESLNPDVEATVFLRPVPNSMLHWLGL